QFDLRGELFGRPDVSRAKPRRQDLRKGPKINHALGSNRGNREQPRGVIQIQVEVRVVFDYQQIVLIGDLNKLSTASRVERNTRRVLKVGYRVDAFRATARGANVIYRLAQAGGHDSAIVLRNADKLSAGISQGDDASDVAWQFNKGDIAAVQQHS